MVLNAVVGFAGIHATLWSLEHGVDLALANKESLVAAGDLALAARDRGAGPILPVDSEHSALHQCLEGRAAEQVDSLVLTGVGRAVPRTEPRRARRVTPEEALAHPTWRMGPKITVDSATLANKGLELIEAHFLFDIPTSASRSCSSRPRSCTRSCASATARRWRISATRTCACRSPTR